MINMIDNRLKSLVKYIDSTDKVIDIGCDHALLDIYLIKNNILNNIIVSDISSNALNQGIKNIKKYNLESFIDTRLGNGLEVLNSSDNIDTIIISGMGTNTILDILNNSYFKNINKLIIQSNKDYYTLRKYLTNNGFYISNEEAVFVNDKVYLNIVFIRGNKEYNEYELKFGTNMLNKEKYYKYLIDKKVSIKNKVTDINKINELDNEIEYKKVKYNKINPIWIFFYIF